MRIVRYALLVAVALGSVASSSQKVRSVRPTSAAQQFLRQQLEKVPAKRPITVEALSARTFTGKAASDRFGYSVASGNDLNGDGYSDFIVGAPYGDAGGSDAGRVYIYFGGPTVQSMPNVVITGAGSGDNFGYCVASAGDVNGDGYADVIVGAPGNDAGGADAGRAYVYFGGPGMNMTPDVTLTGAVAGDAFGFSVSGAGDVNGDGYADVIVGAYYNDAGG